MRKTIVSAALALASLGAGAMAVSAESVSASEAEQKPPQLHWHFEGPFGTYDRAAAQRGYQVYAEVCSACHSLQLLAYRNLMELDLTENQVKGLIKDIQVPDLGDDGQAIERPARLSDSFKKPFANPAIAAAANNGKAPPDLSVMIKAREDGPKRTTISTSTSPVTRSACRRRWPTTRCSMPTAPSRRSTRKPPTSCSSSPGRRSRTWRTASAPAFASSSSCWPWPA